MHRKKLTRSTITKMIFVLPRSSAFVAREPATAPSERYSRKPSARITTASRMPESENMLL